MPEDRQYQQKKSPTRIARIGLLENVGQVSRHLRTQLWGNPFVLASPRASNRVLPEKGTVMPSPERGPCAMNVRQTSGTQLPAPDNGRGRTSITPKGKGTTGIALSPMRGGFVGLAREYRMKISETKLYLCGPINGCTDTEANTWRDRITHAFPQSINPMVRDYRGVEDAAYREIVELDKRDIRNSDIVLVNYVKPSVGTSMEVFYVWSIGKPVITWAIKGCSISPWLRYHTTIFCSSQSEVISAVKRVMQ